MEFRWLAAIALWTLFSGPVFGPPSGSASRSGTKNAVRTATTVPQHTTFRR